MAGDATWRILVGDVRERLRDLDAGSVQTCVTSPPYFGLRDYGHDGQIGLEPSPDEFVAALVETFREVRRVLRDDGTVWLNLGDSYCAHGSDRADRSGATRRGTDEGRQQTHRTREGSVAGAKQKDLLGIPWMVAFALRADGWYLRSDIIWAKPNPMPESVTDRPTKAHEYLFLLSKGPRYFYDADAIREEHLRSSWTAVGDEAGTTLKGRHVSPPKGSGNGDRQDAGTMQGASYHPHGRNRRSVWTVATQPYAGAHFATFPPKLIEPCILAGSPETCCGECGAPYRRVVERTPMVVEPSTRRQTMEADQGDRARTQTGGTMTQAPTSRTVCFEPSCGHADDTGRAMVLDPFTGSGTTGMVALRHGRSFVGCELNPAYATLARERIVGDAPLLNSVAEVA